MIGGGFFGPFTMAAQMLGVEDFMVELLDGEEEEIKWFGQQYRNKICNRQSEADPHKASGENV